MMGRQIVALLCSLLFFAQTLAKSIEVSVDQLDRLPDGRYVYNLIDNDALLPDNEYTVSIAAKNAVGVGNSIVAALTAPSGPPDAPSNGHLATLSHHHLPITEATVTWDAPSTSSTSANPNSPPLCFGIQGRMVLQNMQNARGSSHQAAVLGSPYQHQVQSKLQSYARNKEGDGHVALECTSRPRPT